MPISIYNGHESDRTLQQEPGWLELRTRELWTQGDGKLGNGWVRGAGDRSVICRSGSFGWGGFLEESPPRGRDYIFKKGDFFPECLV